MMVNIHDLLGAFGIWRILMMNCYFILWGNPGQIFFESYDLAVHLFDLHVQTMSFSDLCVKNGVDIVFATFQ